MSDQPDPIKAAITELFDGMGSYDDLGEVFREILTRRFAPALRALRAMELLESKRITVEPSPLGPLLDAVMEAAGEETDADRANGQASPLTPRP